MIYMRYWLVMVGLLACAGMVRAADISMFTVPYTRTGGAITFTEKLRNVEAAVTVSLPDVIYSTSAGSAQFRNGAWTGVTGTLAADEGIIRLLGFNPAWSALPASAVQRNGTTVTVTANGTYTVQLDQNSGRIVTTATPSRSFRYVYATNFPVASRVEIRAGSSVSQVTRTSIAGGQASSGSSALSGLGGLLGFGGSTQASAATAGTRGLDTVQEGGAQSFAAGGDGTMAVGAGGLPAISISEEELAQFIAAGGLHLPAAPVTE